MNYNMIEGIVALGVSQTMNIGRFFLILSYTLAKNGPMSMWMANEGNEAH